MSSIIPQSPSTDKSGITPTPSARQAKQIPTDILYLLRDELVNQKAFGTIANLVQCNSQLQAVFTPGLKKPHVIKLQGEESRKVFADILGADTPPHRSKSSDSHSAPNRASRTSQDSRSVRKRFGPYERGPLPRSVAPLQPSEPWLDGANPHRQKARLHHRRLNSLRECEVLHILDFPAAEVLVDAIFAAGDDEYVFRDIESVCFGSDLLWRLAEGTDITQDIVQHFKDRLRPRHVCFTLSIGEKQKTIDRLERLGKMPSATDDNDAWAEYYVHASESIQLLCEAWAPESITIHGLTAENIPAVYSNQTTIFFGPCPDPKASVDPLFWRADVRSEEIADGLVMLNDDDCVTFVGLEEFSWDRRGLREAELGRISVEERVWQQVPQLHVREEVRPRVNFVRADEAKKCRCCGEK